MLNGMKMLIGEELGRAIDEAIKLKGVTKVKVAEHFGIKPPSVNSWIKTGRISKEHIEKLVEYFSDVVSPEPRGGFPVLTSPYPALCCNSLTLLVSIANWLLCNTFLLDPQNIKTATT